MPRLCFGTLQDERESSTDLDDDQECSALDVTDRHGYKHLAKAEISEG